jgi:hypothetical protein
LPATLAERLGIERAADALIDLGERHRVVVDTSPTSPLLSSSSRSSARLHLLSGTPRVAGSSQATALA